MCVCVCVCAPPPLCIHYLCLSLCPYACAPSLCCCVSSILSVLSLFLVCLSFGPSVGLFACLALLMCFHLSCCLVRLSLFLVCPTVCPSVVCPSICISFLSVLLSICLALPSLPSALSVHPSVCLSVSQVCLSSRGSWTLQRRAAGR